MNRWRWAVVGALVGMGLLGFASAAAPTVVLNEIAWGGTAANGQDEWIELRNCGTSSVDLAGWVLMVDETRIPLSIAENGTAEVRRSTIEAGGFLLLERTDDTTVSDIAADVLYRGSLPNDGADIVLLDANGNMVDAGRFAATGWPAGSGSEGAMPYATMERVDPIEMGDVWRTNDGLVVCGTDSDGKPLQGTPRAPNSATVDYLTTPRVQLLAPVVGETSCPVTVQWQAVDPDGQASALRISVAVRPQGGDEWDSLAEGLTGQGSYVWNCSSFGRGIAYEIRIAATDQDGRTGSAVSQPITLR